MHKELLTEQAIYSGDVKMPKGFEIERDVLTLDTFVSKIKNADFEYSPTFGKLSTYIIEHLRVKHNLIFYNKNTWGNFYKPNETTPPLINVNYNNLMDSPDYTLLYGVAVEDCTVTIKYDDNRRKGRSWSEPLTNNKFIMFPSTNTYYITNKQKDILNFIQTITYVNPAP
ncbi:MAG TPA: hypothetical protein DHV22_10180 [Xanthomarina gelatinilytica]|mgnify:CR=1 FL=1|uniref:Uncharacterized protein n=1 Tax=Xanthomarina gelatinilytica TaxID=1137281 RepID=A0A3D6BTC3_9FLAO|nr:hypothetical protein [Xanthomarina gelatinilytica]|tara:strand:+ start:1576 stop:2085 length:510 start_codon:yes stop_codon:yes gene_type:complete